MYTQSCVICASKKHDGSYDKFRISENQKAEQFLQATSFFQDEVYVRTCDLQDGSTIWCTSLLSSFMYQYIPVVYRQVIITIFRMPIYPMLNQCQ